MNIIHRYIYVCVRMYLYLDIHPYRSVCLRMAPSAGHQDELRSVFQSLHQQVSLFYQGKLN